ncbi:MAG: SLC13 family permease, partial [Thermoanaerobaculia bacterium]|nr:SLC13 family permease [Thermoanaerobaculia bacterium]
SHAFDAEAWRWLVRPHPLRPLLGAAGQATLSTLLTLALALPLAWRHHARRIPWSRAALAFHAAPFVLPVFVIVQGVRAVLGPHGWLHGVTGLDALAFLGPLGAVVVAYVLFEVVPLTQIFDYVEWPVIVLLGSMIPISEAVESSGGSELVAGTIVELSGTLPTAALLSLLMVITMTLSDVLNNVATALIAAPIAVDIAERLGANPDAFLMGVAVAASCAFLTPIGHKNNTIILGPGGYRFGDYWRLGLPLELLVLAIGIPTLLAVWPLYP